MDAWLSVHDPADFRKTVLEEERFMSLHLAERGPTAKLVGREMKDVQWPEGTLVALVRRDGEFLVPGGSTTLEAGDRLSIVGEARGLQEIRSRFGGATDLEIPDFITGETDA